jgi:hypothetical protein
MSPIDAFWDDPERDVIHLKFHDRWAWPDFVAALNAIKPLLAEVPHPNIAIIHNLLDVQTFPAESDRYINQVLAEYHPKINVGVTVGSAPWLKIIHTILVDVHSYIGRDYPMMQSLDEARVFVKYRLRVLNA